MSFQGRYSTLLSENCGMQRWLQDPRFEENQPIVHFYSWKNVSKNHLINVLVAVGHSTQRPSEESFVGCLVPTFMEKKLREVL